MRYRLCVYYLCVWHVHVGDIGTGIVFCLFTVVCGVMYIFGENITFAMPFANFFNLPSKLNINEFPDELLLEIFEKLDYEDLCRCSG